MATVICSILGCYLGYLVALDFAGPVWTGGFLGLIFFFPKLFVYAVVIGIFLQIGIFVGGAIDYAEKAAREGRARRQREREEREREERAKWEREARQQQREREERERREARQQQREREEREREKRAKREREARQREREEWEQFFRDFSQGNNYSYNDNRNQSGGSRQNHSSHSEPDLSNINECYAFLECDPQISNEDLKKHYRQMMKENHPDKLGPNISQKIRDFATERAKKISEAYENIKRYRGM